jgi:hypothetical protein
VPRFRAAQSTCRQHPDANNADSCSPGSFQNVSEVLRGKARHELAPGAGIKWIVDHLGGVDCASVNDLMEGISVTDRRNAEEANLALALQALERRYHFLQHGLGRNRIAAGIARNIIMELEEIDSLSPKPA